jgi:hypothetical protein
MNKTKIDDDIQTNNNNDDELKQLKNNTNTNNRDYGTTSAINDSGGRISTITSNKARYSTDDNTSSNDDDDDTTLTTTTSTNGNIVKNEYFFNDNEDFSLNNDHIEILNEKLYKEHFKTTPAKTNLPIFTSANKSSVLTNVSVDTGTFKNSPTTSTSTLSSLLTNKSSAEYTSAFTVCNNNGTYGRFAPTNRHYEAIKQNKFNSIQNNKLYDEVHEINESQVTTTQQKTKKSSSTTSDSIQTSRSESSSPSCSSQSSLDDEGYCDSERKLMAATTSIASISNPGHIAIKIEDSDSDIGITNYNKNFKKQTSLDYRKLLNNNDNDGSLLNEKYKFEKKIESTAAAAQQQLKYKSLDSYSFDYVDDDDAADDDNIISCSNSSSKNNNNSEKFIDRNKEINSNTRLNSSNLKDDFINHHQQSYAPNDLLQDLTSRLDKKHNILKISTTVQSYVNNNNNNGKSNLQFNNYNIGKITAEVDKQIAYGLKSSTSSLPSTTMTTTCTTGVTAAVTKGYNKLSSTLFTNSADLYKPIHQTTHFEIDSHGSTGTNSSNHDDSSDRSEECFESSKNNNNVSFWCLVTKSFILIIILKYFYYFFF